jgi:hypothetical protein
MNLYTSESHHHFFIKKVAFPRKMNRHYYAILETPFMLSITKIHENNEKAVSNSKRKKNWSAYSHKQERQKETQRGEHQQKKSA